jgi:hypothetical protein
LEEFWESEVGVIVSLTVGVMVFLLTEFLLLIVLEMVVLLLLIVLEMVILFAMIFEMIVLSQIESNLSVCGQIRF